MIPVTGYVTPDLHGWRERSFVRCRIKWKA
jgi:hypothetical protein